MRIVLVLILCFFGQGCVKYTTEDCEGRFTYSASEWAGDDLAQLLYSAEAWNAFTGRQVLTLTPVQDNPGRCHVTNGLSEALAEMPNKAGAYEKGTGNVSVHRETGAALANTLIHELGHGLGLPHLETDGHMMSAGARSWDFTPEDLAHCQLYGVCQ